MGVTPASGVGVVTVGGRAHRVNRRARRQGALSREPSARLIFIRAARRCQVVFPQPSRGRPLALVACQPLPWTVCWASAARQILTNDHCLRRLQTLNKTIRTGCVEANQRKKGQRMTDFQQWQLWLGFAGFFIGAGGLILSGISLYMQWRNNRTKLRVRPDIYHLPVDIEHRPHDLPDYLMVRVTNESAFPVRIVEVGLVVKKAYWLFRQLVPLRCWHFEIVEALWPESYNPIEVHDVRGIMIEARSLREFHIAQEENADSRIRWGKAVYVKTGDERVVVSTRFWALPLLWGFGGSRSLLRQWKNNAEDSSVKCAANVAELERQWAGRQPEEADMSRLLFTIVECSSGALADRAGEPVIRFSVSNAGPYSVNISATHFGISAESPDMDNELRNRLNRTLLPPLIHTFSELPYNLGPDQPFEFWVSMRELVNVFKNCGFTGRVECSVFCGAVNEPSGSQSEPFLFDCEAETVLPMRDG